MAIPYRNPATEVLLTQIDRKASVAVMKPYFAPLIRRWPTVVVFAEEVGCPERSAREWLRIDSIPAAWFNAVALAASKRPADAFGDVTVERLADIAEARRLAAKSATSPAQAAA